MFLEECRAARQPVPAASWVQHCDGGMNSSPVLFLPSGYGHQVVCAFPHEGGSEPWASGLLQEAVEGSQGVQVRLESIFFPF